MGYKGTKYRSILCKCKECNKEFYEYKSRISDGRGIFCSKKCQYKWESESPIFADNIRKGILKLFKEDKNYRKRISYGTKKAMSNPLIREKCRNAPKLKGKSHPFYKERKQHIAGYIIVKNKDGDIFEHRKIIEENINRKLTEKEVIHHINCNKEDNSINNLILFPSHSEHQKFHSLAYKFLLNFNLLDEYINFFIKNGGKCVRITK